MQLSNPSVTRIFTSPKELRAIAQELEDHINANRPPLSAAAVRGGSQRVIEFYVDTRVKELI